MLSKRDLEQELIRINQALDAYEPSPRVTTGTLRFNLDDPDSLRDFKRAVKALDMALVIWDWAMYMRLIYRGKIERPSIEEEHDKWLSILSAHNVDYEEIVS